MVQIFAKVRRHVWHILMPALLVSLVIMITLNDTAAARSRTEDDNNDSISVSIFTDDDVDINQIIPVGSTVREALRAAEIRVGEFDRTVPALDDIVKEFDRIRVLRRERELYTLIDDLIPFQRVYIYSPELEPGEEIVEVYGEDGLRTATYSRIIYNGKIEEEILEKEMLIKPPVNERVLRGFQMKPVSDFDFEAEFDENGEPIGATAVLRSQRTTAYTASGGSFTATGRPARLGHVAVNPQVIPYGSKLFIQSSDGEYVYGYAIAADTGGSIKRGAIDLDIFFNTRSECIQFGSGMMDVYILP